MSGKKKICIALVVFVAACIRLSIAGQGLTYLDRMFLPDDTYYTLSISRSIATNLVPSTDGEVLTSGFQPLTAFFMAPFFAVGVSNDNAVVASILLSAIFGALACGLFAKIICEELDSPLIAVVFGVIAATSPLVIRNDMNGLETSLALFFSLCSISAYSVFARKATNRNAIILGSVIGLMILSRIDTAIFAVLIELMILLRVGLRKSLVVPMVAVLVVAPWWMYCAVMFGSPVPESGAAVRQLIDMAGNQNMPVDAAASLAAATLLSGVSTSFFSLQGSLSLLLVFMCFVAMLSLKKYKLDGLALLMVGGVILCLFYVLYLPAFWFFHRYLHSSIFSLVSCFSVFLWLVLKKAQGFRSPIIVVIGVLLTVLNINGILPFYSRPRESLYGGVDGAKGYREVAIDMLSSLPDGAILGAPQSGALGYYTGRNIKVVNLDGVVNRNAYEAIKVGRLSDFIVSSRINYVAGWVVNINHIGLHSVYSKAPLNLREVARFKAQGVDQFSLYVVFSD